VAADLFLPGAGQLARLQVNRESHKVEITGDPSARAVSWTITEK